MQSKGMSFISPGMSKLASDTFVEEPMAARGHQEHKVLSEPGGWEVVESVCCLLSHLYAYRLECHGRV